MCFKFLSIIIVTIFFAPVFSSQEKSKNTLNDQFWFPYSDSNAGGKSENYGTTNFDSCVQWTFQLKRMNQQQWPFAGISKTIESSEMSHKSEDDTLVTEIRSNRTMRIQLRLLTFDPEITKPDDIKTYRVLEYPFTVTKEKKRIAVPLKQFRVSEWWKRIYNIPPEDNRLFLDSICKFNCQVTGPEYIDQIDTVTIFTLDINDRKRPIFGWLMLIIFPGIIYVLFYFYRKQIKNSKLSIHNSIQIRPRQIETTPSDWARVLNYIENNYTDPQLSIQKIAKELGYSSSKLSHIISEKYSSGFRGLVHEFRVDEGKRLLKDSELNVSEIAYKLGYATPSHFNREFKKRIGFSPTAFRKG